jgi:hypothetical protein
MPNAKSSLRPVHDAMADLRPEKNAVRQLWIERAIFHSAQSPNLDDPLYLTLSGAEGAELSMLVDAGLLELTEVDSIASRYKHRVVAIENNHAAYTKLQTKFPGLKILRDQVSDLLHGTTRTRYPQGEREQICRSRIVNLDLNEAWMPQLVDGQWIVPVARWIAKFAEMHARAPKLSWTLFLTLHGECPWPPPPALLISDEICAISELSAAIRNKAQDWLTSEVFSQILDRAIKNYGDLSAELQQRVLMWLVPSAIVRDCASQGWAISIHHNLRYGRPPQHAPMVTWIIDFNVPERDALSFQQELLDGLMDVLNKAGYIDAEGNINYYDQQR